MIIQRRFIVVSGLPASGKSTLARQLAPAFGLPLYDKDDILEALFDTMGPANADLRHRLSRASDRVMTTLVEQSCGAVLTSFWRNPGDEGNSGTPCEWLGQLSPSIVEVYCRCEPESAVQRFLRRSRHPGHLDAVRNQEALLTQFRRIRQRGPLGIGRVIAWDTATRQDPETLIEEITTMFAEYAASPPMG
jgi:AAA domain